MTKPVFFTDKRPWVDARNKEKMADALIERMDEKTGISDAGIDEIVKDARVENPRAGVRFLRRLKELGKSDLRSRTFDVRGAFRSAVAAYRRIDDAQPTTAGVYGLDLATMFEQWCGAHDVMEKARQLDERLELAGDLDTSHAETTIAALTPTMRAFADSYDAMLRGEKTVSDVMPKATMFALFPELRGKDLPALHDALADLISRADEGMLVGLFNHRWLKFDTSEEFRVHGPLKGDLNMFVAYLRNDAEALRNGTVFGPSQGWGRPGTKPDSNYLRSTDENPGEGLIPAFLSQLALPTYRRDTFLFGDKSREQLPTYGNKDAPPVTIRVDGAKITIA